MPDARHTPLPPPPRQLRRQRGGPGAPGCARVFILPHVIIGLCLLGVVPLRVGVQTLGRPVTAMVDHLTQTHGRKGAVSYRVGFHYALDGHRHDDAQDVTADEFRQRHLGDRLTGRVGVFFGHPLCLTTAGSTTRRTLVLTGAAAFWNAIVAVFVYALWIAPWRLRRLLENGTAVAGEVVSRRTAPPGRSGPTVHVRYRFPTPRGPVEGTATVPAKLIQRLGPTRPITVVYDPARPRRNAVYEFAGYVVRPMVG